MEQQAAMKTAAVADFESNDGTIEEADNGDGPKKPADVDLP